MSWLKWCLWVYFGPVCDKIPCSKFEIWAYHLNGLLLSFQKNNRKPFWSPELSYRADSSTLNTKYQRYSSEWGGGDLPPSPPWHYWHFIAHIIAVLNPLPVNHYAYDAPSPPAPQVIPFTGRYSVRVLHTPGHTPESVVYLLTDNTNNTPIQVHTSPSRKQLVPKKNNPAPYIVTGIHRWHPVHWLVWAPRPGGVNRSYGWRDGSVHVQLTHQQDQDSTWPC